jgi:hypothetical protein|tara:strand:- start:695 stop:985 length:291 start_codon:yes stop_codon:yes gene_type:complete
MKRLLLITLLVPLLSNCGQFTTMIGPSYTLVETGSVVQTSTSLSKSFVARKVRQNISKDLRSEKYCQKVHSSELTEIFFETTEHMDCYYDPMSILR